MSFVLLFFTAILLERISKFKISISAMKLLAVRTQNKIFLFRKSSVRAGCCDLMLSLSLSPSFFLSSSPCFCLLAAGPKWAGREEGTAETALKPQPLFEWGCSPARCSAFPSSCRRKRGTWKCALLSFLPRPFFTTTMACSLRVISAEIPALSFTKSTSRYFHF